MSGVGIGADGERRVAVRVPASSANLGPGFDVLAAALDLHVELEARETGTFAVETDLKIARDRRNLAVRAFARLRPVDDVTFTIRSQIPLAGGLGTSAAAIVAGLLAAHTLNGGGGEDLLGHATELEGHPDNVAAALLGGVVICVAGRAVRLEPPPGLAGVLVVPEVAVRTKAARAVLPELVSLPDAVANVGYVSLLTLGLERGDFELIAMGLADRLHQPYRAPLFPKSAALLARARDLGAVGATVSGAGPTVLLWAREAELERVQDRASDACAGWGRALRTSFTAEGAVVL